MPISKKRASRRSRPRKGRRVPGRRTNRLVNPSRNLSCIPDKLATKLVYSDFHTLTPSTVPVYHLYRSMSINDPNYTGVGHQPLGHDQFQSLYQQYRVNGVAYRMQIVNQTATATATCFVLHKPDTSTPAGNDLLWEKPAQKHTTVGIKGSGQAIRYIKGYINNAKVNGLTKNQYVSEKANSAAMGANPTNEAFITIGASSVDGATSCTMYVRVQLIYYVEFFQRKPLSQS